MSGRVRDELLAPLLEDADDEVMPPFAAWLMAEAGPDDWHRVMLGWNWDAGLEVPHWISVQPDCDKATALLVFWATQPEYYVEFAGRREDVPEVNREGLDLLEEVRRRWLSGAYTRGEIAFDLDAEPASWPRDFADLEARFGDRVAEVVPVDMRRPLAGRVIGPGDEIEGVPARFWPEDAR